MTEQEFCYWLQGYFEIANLIIVSTSNDPKLFFNPMQLNDAQVKCIKEHLDLVEETNKELGEFTAWLRILMVAHEEGMDFGTQVITKIRQKLAARFKHVIDPQAGDYMMQQKLNFIHGNGQDDRLARC